MTIIDERASQLDTIHLDHGAHDNFDLGHCAMEVVAWLAGEGHTDAPQCASPVLRRFTIGLNDRWSDEHRQSLVPLLPRMVGTAGDGKDETRAFMCADWAVRECLPIMCTALGRQEDAEALRALSPITDKGTALAGRDKARELRKTYATSAADAYAAAYASASAAADAYADASADAYADASADAYAAAYASASAAADAYAAAYADAVRASALGLLERLIDAA